MKGVALVSLLFIYVAIIAAGSVQVKSLSIGKDCFSCATAPSGTIFCDDFENDTPLSERYFEYDDNNGDFKRTAGVGRDGSAGMRIIWQKGEVAAGSLKKSIGRVPGTYLGRNAVQPEKDFKEIWWRIDVRTQPGWTGGGADKLTRATVFVDSGWSQGLIAHVWSSGNYLVIDPASGIDENGKLKSTRYNDFAHLRWLGNKKGTTDLFSDANAGKWYCVTAHIKMNTPGLPDGVFEYWIDDVLQAASYNLNWHGDWNAKHDGYMINAVLFENYWNNGSPKLQERYFDNLLISSEPIRCKCAE